jgi:hypothetical protein
MDTGYLDLVLKRIEPMFDAIQNPFDLQLILAATMTRCLNCNSRLYRTAWPNAVTVRKSAMIAL